MRGRAGINPANQLRTGQEQGRSAETRCPRTPLNSRKIEAHDAPAPRLGEASRTVPIGDPTRTAGTRIQLQRPEVRNNRHYFPETTESGDNLRRNKILSRPRERHSLDKSIAEHCHRPAQSKLSLTPKIKQLSFINWQFPIDGIYRRHGKSLHQAQPQQASSTPPTNDSPSLQTVQSICTYQFPSDGVYRRNRTIPQQAHLHRPFSLAKQRLQKLRLELQSSKRGFQA